MKTSTATLLAGIATALITTIGAVMVARIEREPGQGGTGSGGGPSKTNSPSTATPFYLMGYVTDADRKSPLSGINLKFTLLVDNFATNSVTDKDGFYTINLLTPVAGNSAQMRLVIQTPGFSNYDKVIPVSSGQQLNVELGKRSAPSPVQIPLQTYHFQVVSGDTEAKIAARFHISVSALQQANPDLKLNVDKVLKIPQPPAPHPQ